VLVLIAVAPATAAVPDDLAAAFPPGAVAYAETNDLGMAISRLESSEYLATVLASPQVKQLQQTAQYRIAQAARIIAERQLGIDPVTLVRKLLGDRAALAVYLNEQNPARPHVVGLLAAEPGVLAPLRERLDPFVTLSNGAVQAMPGPHATELLTFGDKVFAAWKGDWLAVSTRRELLDGLIVRMHGAQPAHLAQDEAFRAMRKSLAEKATADSAARPTASQPARLLQVYVNMPMVNKIAGGRLVPEKLENALASLLFGDTLETIVRSPFAAVTIDLEEHGFVAALSVSDGRTALGEAYRGFFPTEGQPAVAPLPDVPARIGGFSIYRDFADWYIHRQQLLQDQTLPGFDQFESGIANILPGRDFGEDILPVLGKRVTFLAAPQDYSHLDAPPGIRLPGFAAVVELAKVDEGADLLHLLFQTLTAVINLTAGQEGRQPWVMTSETYQGVQIAYARYLKKPKGDSLGVVYNFLPAAAHVGNHFVFSSSLGLCRQIVDDLKHPKPSADPLRRTIDTQVRFDPLADIIAANRDFFTGRLVQQGRSAEQAQKEFGMLVDVLRQFDSLRFSTAPGPGAYQVRIEGSWK
jgi:hypothetical protein